MSQHGTGKECTLVALVPTTKVRRELLFRRSIPSVLAQTRLPDLLIVVLDGDDDASLKEPLHQACRGRVDVIILRNFRTKGLSGTINTAIDWLQRDPAMRRDDGIDVSARADQVYAAIIDDDDHWEPDHLRLCLRAACDCDLHMVAAGLVRRSGPNDPGKEHDIPQQLNPREQFIRGQHIQGSNLFVRLDALLNAGCFDERLPSCTDRDLCIRLARLPDFRFGCISQHTVHHFAEPRPDRLSTPGSNTKLDGLDRFWSKYQAQFDDDARAQFLERAADLFGWTPAPVASVMKSVQDMATPPRAVDLVVGFVTDSQINAHARELLEDLLLLSNRPGINSLVTVVIENGPVNGNLAMRPIQAMVNDFLAKGLEVDLITVERQINDWTHCRLIDTPNPEKQRLPIAVARTILNTYVARAAQRKPGSWAWILDDDKRLFIRLDMGDSRTEERPSPDLASLCALQDAGCDVVIGPDCGAPPLPFTATLRMPLVDLAHNLNIVANLHPDAPWPSCPERPKLKDFYYDLSRETEHLETPFALRPAPGRSTAAEVLSFLGGRADRLLAGEPVFRPLTVDPEHMDPCRLENSIQRGGSTFFFNPAVLLRIPQTIARVGNRFVRRSDMLVSQLMRDQLGLRIIMHPAAGVTHSRTHTHKTTPEDRTLGDDVLGYALCRTAEEIASSLPAEQRGQPLLSFSNEEAAQAIRRFTKYLNERLASVKLSGWRILGLAKTIRFTAASLLSPSSAWATDPSRESLNRLVNEMDGIIDMYRPEDVANRCESVRSGVTDRDIRNAFLSMEGLVTEYLETYSDYRAEDDKRTELRKTRARALLAREYGITSPRLLGLGGEGIAFTDDVRVYKVLDILKRRPNHDTLQTLRTLVKPSGDTKHLYALERVDEVDETIVVVYPFEKSEPYAGGHGRGLLEMLRECKAAGIVCRNIHPSNLRVTAGRPRLIDYGADIRPFSDAEFRAMSERTYLTWRWPHRNDLKDVMRRALQDKSLPELDGFDRFWNAVNNHGASASQVVLDLLDTERSIAAGARVLDYGCGSGLLVRQLTSNGCSVVGYDPDPERDKSWSQIQELPQGCRFTHNREDALASGPYECVTCTLVLCEVPDGPVYEQALADIRQSVTANGSVHIVVCNPFSVFAGPTRLHPERRLPGGAQYEDCFPYHDVSTSGRARAEFHRPLSRLRRDLLRHHLIITEIRESQTVDFDRFEPASDFLLLRCQPVQIANPSREISLVIKTCALESKTIEVQVEHLVGQLESPRVFRERILAIDPKMDGFARQYRDIVPSDLQELQNAAKRLVKRGLIDRIILGPTDPGELRSINREWFGLDLAASHSARNTPMAAQLVAFENASCEFVLQVDADLIVYRQDRAHDYLGEMIGAIDAAPRALTASLNVAQDRDIPYSFNDGTRPWRVEVRGCLFHRERLLRARPFPNPEVDGQPARPWHRSMDIAAADGRFLSLRGGGSSTFFVHPPNIVKDSAGDWLLLYDLAEKGHRPPSAQIGKVELQGKKDDSLPKARVEPYVFILTGRNVPPGRVRRCLHSLAKQEGNWGAVIMDDASDPLCRDYLAELAAHHDSRITMIHAPAHRGQIANMLTAIGHICANPDSVMITLDLDDALLGSQVISRLEQEYSAGADVTIGTMLRTDKHKAYPVQFVDARKVRGGGNVWQHLRTFRKRLFDSVPKSALKLDNGCFVDVAVDWAFMLPIVEMAKHPVWIQEPLYLYEPSMMLGQGPRRADRDAQITQIVARTPLCDPSLLASPSLLTPEQITCLGKHMSNGVLFIRHAHRPGFAGLTEEARDAVPLTAEGVKEATRIGRYLPHFDRAVASPAPRSCMTAEFIAKGAGVTLNSPPKFQSLCRMRGANPAYEEYKKKHGWKELLRAWFKDETPPHVVVPVHEVVRGMCEDAELWLRDSGDGLIVAVTHDFAIAGLLAVLAGSKSTTVPYLSGVFVTADTMHNYFANKERR